MNYDFRSLSPLDFEDLVRDLVEADLQVTFEGFSPGKDGGIDGRHCGANGNLILQAKHYIDSGYVPLRARLKKEKPAIEKLAPTRYILATSARLTPKRKDEITNILVPYIKSTGDIYEPTRLNALLRKNSDIERAHFKLWLTSTAVLERVLHAAIISQTVVTKSDIIRKLQLYVSNRSLEDARAILEREHVVIISGAPGVGKTTLAEMLSRFYIGEEFELYTITDLEQGHRKIEDGKRQLFMFDDFLGKVRLTEDAVRHRDSEIVAFIKRVRLSPNSRFILTTRQYILERARQVSESLADEKVAISRYVLDVGSYTRRIRARIIYNHVLYSNLPHDFVVELIKQGAIGTLVDHKHFNPRLIEWMTDVTYLKGVEAKSYPTLFVTTLDHPEKLWDHAFRQHIQPRSQHLLIALYFFEYGTTISILRSAYEPLHTILCKAMNLATDFKDFDIALKELEGSFIKLSNTNVEFINPSVADYLSSYLTDRQIISCMAKASSSARWARSVWRFGSERLTKLGLISSQLADMFESSAINVPLWSTDFVYEQNSFGFLDLSLPERLELLLEWWSSSPLDIFATAFRKIASRAPKDFERHWDVRDLGGVLVTLKSEVFLDFPNCAEACVEIESKIGVLLSIGDIDAKRIKEFRDIYSEHQQIFSAKSLDALHSVIVQQIENVNAAVKEIESREELDAYEVDITELASWAGVEFTFRKFLC